MTRLLALSFPREVLNRRALNAGRAVAVFAALAMGATAAQGAQLSHTFVAGAGDDTGTCGRDHPCATFKRALEQTLVNGEVICLDKGNFATATIIKSVSIDCHDAVGSVFQPGNYGIMIDFSRFLATDVRKTVNLRGLNVQGFDGGWDGILITDPKLIIIGADVGVTGGSVFIEDCVINGEFGSTAGRGIADTRAHGGELSISDTTVRNMGGSGIVIVSATTGQPTSIHVTIDNVRVQHALFGLAAGNGTKVMVNRSVFSGNSSAGIEADTGANVIVSNSVSVHNNIGVESIGSILLSNSDISFNKTAVSGTVVTGVPGPVFSYRNNRFSDNDDPGIALSHPAPGLQ